MFDNVSTNTVEKTVEYCSRGVLEVNCSAFVFVLNKLIAILNEQ